MVTSLADGRLLASNLDWYQVAFVNSQDPTVILDAQGIIFDANPAFCQVLGYSLDELRSMERVDWDVTAEILEETKDDWLSELPPQGVLIERKLRRRDGSSFDSEVRIQVLFLHGQRFAYCVHRDMTELKQTQQNLQRKHFILEVLREFSSHLITAQEKEALLVKALANVTRLDGVDGYLNFDYSEASGKLLLVDSKGVPPEAGETLKKLELHQFLCGVAAATRRVVHSVYTQHSVDPAAQVAKAMGFRTCYCVPLVADEGLHGVLSFFSVTRDSFDDDLVALFDSIANYFLVTRLRLKSLEALRESEGRFRELIQHIDDVFFIFDAAKERFCYLSPSAEELFRTPIEKIRSQNDLLSRIHVDDRMMFEHALSTNLRGQPTIIEFRILRPDGSIRSVVGNSGPLHDGSEVIDRVVGSIRDVTQRVTDQERLATKEAELLHVSRLSTLGLTSAAISHELNQPLTVIVNFASACEGLLEGRSDEYANRLRGYLQEMTKQSLRAGQIVRRLSEFSRKSPSRWSTLDLNLVLLDAVALMEVEMRAKKTRLRYEFTANLPSIQGDRVQLQQVFVNLLSNATDAMAGMPEDDRWVTIRCSRGADCLLVQIDDQGPGISPEAAERIFQPFVTTKSNHSGIGLSICQTIIEAHGGEITFSPSSPRGTRFAVKLPLPHRVVGR